VQEQPCQVQDGQETARKYCSGCNQLRHVGAFKTCLTCRLRVRRAKIHRLQKVKEQVKAQKQCITKDQIKEHLKIWVSLAGEEQIKGTRLLGDRRRPLTVADYLTNVNESA
jgi:hypothetical protein